MREKTSGNGGELKERRKSEIKTLKNIKVSGKNKE